MRQKVLVVGLGQAGNKIADLFGKNGYSSMGINTAEEDMKTLQNIKKFTIGNHGGSGKDRKLAIKQLAGDFPAIYSEVKEAAEGKDIIILVSSLGGGTGSGTIVVTAKGLASRLDKKVIVVGVLPIESEGVNLKENSFNAIAELDQIKDLASIMLVPNDHDYSKINRRVFRQIESLFKLEGIAETDFDRMDLLNSFTGGYTEIVTGVGEDLLLSSQLFDLFSAKSINLVTMTRKRIKGNLILKDYKRALRSNFFEYKTATADSYFAIFAGLNAPAEYVSLTKAEIETAHKEARLSEEVLVDFNLNTGTTPLKKVTAEKKEELDFKDLFDF